MDDRVNSNSIYGSSYGGPVHKPWTFSRQFTREQQSVPLLMYGAPIWIEAIRKNKNLTKYKRIQRLMNIKIAKA